MPSPTFPPDTPRPPTEPDQEMTVRPAWWRRAVATTLRAAVRDNPRGAVRDLAPRAFGGGGRGGDVIPA